MGVASREVGVIPRVDAGKMKGTGEDVVPCEVEEVELALRRCFVCDFLRWSGVRDFNSIT